MNADTKAAVNGKLAIFDAWANAAVDSLVAQLERHREELIVIARGRHVEGHFRYADANFLEWSDGELNAQTAQELADAIVYRTRALYRAEGGGR